MKSIVIAAIAAVAMGAAGSASAQEAAAKSAGCMTCHDVSAKKMGPSFKEVLGQVLGQGRRGGDAGGQARGRQGPPGSEGQGHDLKGIVKWVLAQ